MLNPTLTYNTIKDLVQTYGPMCVKNLQRKTGYPKSVINSILHHERHYLKVERSPLSFKNKKPIWSWSNVEVPLPQKIRVVSAPKTPIESD